MKPRLIALDIDGTLTTDTKEISPKTRDILIEFQKRGIRLLLASARPTHGLYRTLKELDMEDNHGLIMAYNGGKVIDVTNREVISEIDIDRNKVKKILEFLETLPVSVILDDEEKLYVIDRKGYKVQYEARNNDMEVIEVDNLANFVNFNPIKLLLAVEPSIIYEVQREIAKNLDEDLTVVRTAPFYLEIIPKAISKGEALKNICKAKSIDISETIAFGDSENDMSMLEAAGMGIAMANAEEAVKDVADKVTLSNNEDGIYYALKNWF